MNYTTTPALVLHRTRYSDRYSIVHLYSHALGHVAALVPEASNRRNLIREQLRPLSEVEVTLSQSPRRDLVRIQEVRSLQPRHGVHLDPAKGAQAIFLSEFLYRILTAPLPDEHLYDHLATSLTFWEGLRRGGANYHLCLLISLLPVLGISPEISERPEGAGWCFSLSEQGYVLDRHAHCLSPEETLHLPQLLRMTYANMHHFAYSRQQRGVILDYLLDYYRLHLASFPQLKCLPILRQLGEAELEGKNLPSQP